MKTPRYFRRHEAALYVREEWGLPCSPRWLAKLAVTGGGPTYCKAGRTPIYAPADLDDWAQSRIGAPQESTSAKAPPHANRHAAASISAYAARKLAAEGASDAATQSATPGRRHPRGGAQ